ncbi:MAG TPA: BON domain-containing protein [Desulfosarcina sp.]|nr:BON domain-containing protein [Desulfosarcina sp.]
MQATGIEGRRMAAASMIIFFFFPVFVHADAVASEPPVVTDLAISDAVEDELLMDIHVRAHLIDVATKDGVVTLGGSVDDILSKIRAERIAEAVKGVRAVVNTIDVLPPILRSDREIQADVEQALHVDPATDAYEIDVHVRDNVVTLSGSVDSWQERELSGKVAMGVRGVKELRNELRFTDPGRRPDREIEQDIAQALRWDVLVDHASVDIHVSDGKVTLSGTVGSLAEKRQAIGDAYVANVAGVDADRLEVKIWARDPRLRGDKYKSVSDSDIRRAVGDALRYDPRVSSHEVTPEVADRVVTLRGTVDNLKSRRAAYRTARNTVGVRRVVNRIKVRPSKKVDDDQVKSRIDQALARDPVIASPEITVRVRSGVADLFGSVGTFFEKHQAEDLASRVNGVVGVNNFIVVNAVAPPSTYDPFGYEARRPGNFRPHFGPPLQGMTTDTQIKADIEEEFFWSPFVDGDGILVSVENRTATLTGTVDSWREFDAATQNAYEGGAARVDNRLVVR